MQGHHPLVLLSDQHFDSLMEVRLLPRCRTRHQGLDHSRLDMVWLEHTVRPYKSSVSLYGIIKKGQRACCSHVGSVLDLKINDTESGGKDS